MSLNPPLIFNLLPIVSGGGMQNALSFLSCLPKVALGRDCIIICNLNSHAHYLCQELNLRHCAVRHRLWFESFSALRTFGREATAFTLFGPPVLASAGRWINVCGVAYSNLFYPDLDFWADAGPIGKHRKVLIDIVRAKTITLADAWIFETDALLQRALAVGFPSHRVFHVPMAISQLVKPDSRAEYVFPTHVAHRWRILYLASAHPNKRQLLLPDIAVALLRRRYQDFCFITTMDPANSYAAKVAEKSKDLGVQQFFHNVGQVAPGEISALIQSCHAMCLLSRLESFSNNFVEAWAMEVPLIVTDADWSRSSCRDGAIYVDPENAKDTASAISDVITNLELRARLVEAGASVLATFPTAEEKTRLYMEVIAKVEALGPCNRYDKAKIRI